MLRVPEQVGLTVALLVGGVLTSACTLEIVDTLAGADPGLADDAAETDAGDSDSGADGAWDEGGDGAAEGTGAETLFDVGGGNEVQISSCEFAAKYPSHIGCEFYGLDVDGPGLWDAEPYGFVIINPLPEPVEVELERWAGAWILIDQVAVAGEDEHVFLPANNEAHGTGIHPGASLRITSDQPIIVVQAHPAKGVAYSASATMLQPTTAWATKTPVAGWRTHQGVGERAYLAVLSRTVGTTVTVKPTFDIADPPIEWEMDWVDVDDDGELELVEPVEPGELLRLDAEATNAAEVDHGTSGSMVDSGQEHLTSAMSVHTCAAIPDFEGSCGHMQEQLSARLVGTRFVAPRLIATKNPDGELDPDPDAPLVHEQTMVQVVATEPETKIVFFYEEGGAANVLDAVLIDPDEPYAVYESAHDLMVVADKPIVAAAYMTNAELTYLGSPSMVQLAPVEQWTGHHWIWAPQGFETHVLVSASPSANVEIQWLAGLGDDDVPQPSPDLLELGPVAAPGQSWAVRRFVVGPGIHRVESSGPASVIVAGWRSADGFAYLGGWGPSFADVNPPG